MHTGTGLASAWSEGLDGRARRLLKQALIGSLLLHALVLALVADFRDTGRKRFELPQLTARLLKQEPPPPAKVETPPPAPPPPRPAHAAKAPPTPAPPAPVAPTPLPVVAPLAPPAPSAPVVAPAPPATAPAPAANVSPTLSRPESAPAAVASGPDPGNVARFRLELMEVARRYKRYPRIAVDNNWEGRVDLVVAFAESGSIASLTVKRGSGRLVLDEQAQSMIRSAYPQVVIPPSLRGKAFTLEIPVDFSLKE